MLSAELFGIKAKLFHGLADQSRLRILEGLRQGPRCVSELVASTGLSQPNVSAHLACLAGCGLVVGMPEGRRVYYRLAQDDVEALLSLADLVVDRCQGNMAACPNCVIVAVQDLPPVRTGAADGSVSKAKETNG